MIQEHKGNTFNNVILATISEGCREASKREGKDIDRRARKEKENSRDTKDWCAIRRFQNAKREEKEKT